jgi:hypothetical protein
MGINDFFDAAKKEGRILQGEGKKDRLFVSKQDYADEQTAAQEFTRSKNKLFNVEAWSALPGLSSGFYLYDEQGNRKQIHSPKEGDYIRIDLPGPFPQNWVRITRLYEDNKLAEFTVKPSKAPQAGQDDSQVKHFFTEEASSTFQVQLIGNTLVAREIGLDEVINNQGRQAGNHALVNTLIAEGGWAFFQKVQWQKLTDYLVHKID